MHLVVVFDVLRGRKRHGARPGSAGSADLLVSIYTVCVDHRPAGSTGGRRRGDRVGVVLGIPGNTDIQVSPLPNVHRKRICIGQVCAVSDIRNLCYTCPQHHFDLVGAGGPALRTGQGDAAPIRD